MTPKIHLSDSTIPAEIATSTLAKMRGHMFRTNPPEEPLVFKFESPKRRGIHMLFVPFPLDVIWVVDGTVIRSETLSAWTGIGMARADTIVELPAGTVDVEVGDSITVSLD